MTIPLPTPAAPASRMPVFALPVAIASAVAVAWLLRFVQDDAFISFRYAQRLVAGHGLTWNAGEAVEGYTNFAWVLVMALPHAAGIDPVGFVYATGLVIHAANLWLSFRLARHALGSEWAALGVVVLLAANFTFASYATGGLETGLQTLCFLGIAHVVLVGPGVREAGVRRLGGLSLICCAALLTRLDSAVWLLAVTPFLLAALGGSRLPARGKLVRVAAFATPLLVVVGSWLAWKLAYYGSILPNTYHCKVAAGPSWSHGIAYFTTFSWSYGLVPFALLPLVCVPRLRRRENRVIAASVWLGLCWCAYVASVGGDFMEFRFLTPVLPLAFIVLVWSLRCVFSRPLWQCAVAALSVAGSLHHAATFDFENGVEGIGRLAAYVSDGGGRWRAAGRALGALSRDPERGFTIATTAAGAIPYESGLPTVDMHGLNDEWIARHGPVASHFPGHQRLAPPSYLVRRGVHLVLGHPCIVRRGQLARRTPRAADLDRFFAGPLGPILPPGVGILAIPVDDEHELHAVYLHRHPELDAAIRQGRVRFAALREVAAPR